MSRPRADSARYEQIPYEQEVRFGEEGEVYPASLSWLGIRPECGTMLVHVEETIPFSASWSVFPALLHPLPSRYLSARPQQRVSSENLLMAIREARVSFRGVPNAEVVELLSVSLQTVVSEVTA